MAATKACFSYGTAKAFERFEMMERPFAPKCCKNRAMGTKGQSLLPRG
jgi:hypothetical protein